VQGLFGRYVSREIVDYLLEDPARLGMGGVETEASVVFVDIRGFTTRSEGRSPALVLQEVNAFFGEVFPVIDRWDGLVLQYMGDGLLAVFGVPRKVANHAQAAVEAAVEIVRVSRRISDERRRQGGASLRIGCSIHSGPVVGGNVGAAERSQYAVMGDTTNVAARLEELNKAPELNQEFPSEIVLSQATYERLGHPPPVRGPFEFEIRGREGRISVYQVRISDV
jgi:class 3 adenylate cyclase